LRKESARDQANSTEDAYSRDKGERTGIPNKILDFEFEFMNKFIRGWVLLGNWEGAREILMIARFPAGQSPAKNR
jgi:hypothetical protein